MGATKTAVRESTSPSGWTLGAFSLRFGIGALLVMVLVAIFLVVLVALNPPKHSGMSETLILAVGLSGLLCLGLNFVGIILGLIGLCGNSKHRGPAGSGLLLNLLVVAAYTGYFIFIAYYGPIVSK